MTEIQSLNMNEIMSMNVLLSDAKAPYPTYKIDTKVIGHSNNTTTEDILEYIWKCTVCNHTVSNVVSSEQVLNVGHPVYLLCTNLCCKQIEEKQEERKENKMNLLEFVSRQARLKSRDLPTKVLFGEMMHDENLLDKERRRIAEKVMLAGGYDCLEGDKF